MTFIQNTEQAKTLMRKLFEPTMLERNKYLSDLYSANVFLKREDTTPVRSYKIRGAFYFLSSSWDAENPQTFVCASAGNHAQGFAYSCAHFGAKGTVFMPVTTPQQKVMKTQAFGREFIEIVLTGDTFDQAAQAAHDFCNKTEAVFVPPFDHEKIIEGQATIASEILDQMGEDSLDAIVLPVGGGGVSAGVSKFLHEKSPQTEVFLAEPAEAASVTASLESGKLTTLKTMSTFVDGAAVATVGAANFEVLEELITNPVINVPENRLCQTMIDFLNQDGLVMEPAGALAIDALRDLMQDPQWKGKNIICLVSGSNFDFERLPDVKERAKKYFGLKKYIILRLPQRPGALREFLDCLGPEDDIARFEYLKKSAKDFGSVLLGIDSLREENFKTLFQKVSGAGFAFTDVTHDEILADFVI